MNARASLAVSGYVHTLRALPASHSFHASVPPAFPSPHPPPLPYLSFYVPDFPSLPPVRFPALLLLPLPYNRHAGVPLPRALLSHGNHIHWSLSTSIIWPLPRAVRSAVAAPALVMSAVSRLNADHMRTSRQLKICHPVPLQPRCFCCRTGSPQSFPRSVTGLQIRQSVSLDALTARSWAAPLVPCWSTWYNSLPAFVFQLGFYQSSVASNHRCPISPG